MAKAAKKEEQTELPASSPATSSSGQTALALVTNDELAAAELGDVTFETDGLDELDASDVKLAAKVFNMKAVDKNGDPIPANVFYDTVTEETTKELDLVLLVLHKTNEWREFDEAASKSNIKCRSFDRVTGRMEDGTERPCEGCKDAKWETITVDGKSKRTRRCGPVYNVFAIDRKDRQPCVLRFKRTSLPVIQSHINKHHAGRRVVAGKRMNYPLFVFAVRARLEMAKGGKTQYAVPVLERGGVLPREEVLQAQESAKYVMEALLPVLEKMTEPETDDGAEGTPPATDASFNANDYADGNPESSSSSAAEAGNRW